MKTTRKRYSAEFKAKVALEAIRGDLTLAELGAKHGIHHTMIAAWKRQAIEGMASTFAGASEVARVSGEAEIDKFHSKIGQLVVERGFLPKPSVDERGSKVWDGRGGARPVDLGATLPAVDQPVLVLLCATARVRRDVGADAGDRRASLDMPWCGSRQMVRHLRREGVHIGPRRVRQLMTKMGLSPIYQRPQTSDPHPQHRIYPDLLRHLAIERPNHVWCADITYIPMRRGFLYLVAIMDWATRKVLAWRRSNTMNVGFRYGFAGSAGALRAA